MIPLTLADIESAAKEKLPEDVYKFYAAGSDGQNALARNSSAFERHVERQKFESTELTLWSRLLIRPRVLRDVSEVDTSVRIFGWRLPLPIGLAPSAMQRLASTGGELDTARAAVNLNLNMTLSSQSTVSLEGVMQVRKGTTSHGAFSPPFWMQLYLYEDMAKSHHLIRRAEVAGYQALVLTVDTPVLGNRLEERKTPVVLPQGLNLPNLETPLPGAMTQPSINRQLMDTRSAAEARSIRAKSGSVMHSSSMTWEKTIKYLRSVTSMKIIVKGIMTAEDAALAVQYGVDGIVVSNHGGRQLDAASSTIEALPEIVSTARGALPIILDGGIRSGTDVFKAIAMGADFVLVGRPVLWGLAYNGQQGVEDAMNILERELNRTMALAGAKCLGDITKDMLGVVPNTGFGISKL